MTERNRYQGYNYIGLADAEDEVTRHIVLYRRVTMFVLHEIALFEDISRILEDDNYMAQHHVWKRAKYELPALYTLYPGERIRYEIGRDPVGEYEGQFLYPLRVELYHEGEE